MRKRVLSCILAALLLFSLPLVTVSAAEPYNPDFSMFDIGVPFTSGGNIGVNLLHWSVSNPNYQFQAQHKMNIIGANMTAWEPEDPTVKTEAFRLMGLVQEAVKAPADYETAVFYMDQVLALMGITVARDAYAERDMAGYEVQHKMAAALCYERDVNAVEEYVGWSAVEYEQGVFDFDLYIRDARYVKAAGLTYVCKLLPQTMPPWFVDSGDFVKSIDIVTGREIPVMSIFAPSTMDVYEHLYTAAAEYLGEYIDIVRLSTPYDFGETAYVAGVSETLLQAVGGEPGFWVGDESARANFRKTMENKYKTIAALNTAWGTTFTGFDKVEYPDMIINGDKLETTAGDRHFLDFMHWYYDGLTEGIRDIIQIAKKYFPTAPINFNLAMPFEKTCFGFDISGQVKMAAEEGVVTRLPIGAPRQVPWLMWKRFATAARLYKPPQVATEPQGDGVPLSTIAQVYFMDLSGGVTWHKDYFGGHGTGYPMRDAYNDAWHGGEYPIVDVAVFWSNTAHFLDNGLAWYSPDPNNPGHQRPVGANMDGGFPSPDLYLYCQSLRNVMDYDVIDELIISDGFLSEYKYLLWPVGMKAEAVTLEKIAAWVNAGGTLLITDIESVRTVEGDQGAFKAICGVAKTDGVRKYGAGSVIDIDFVDADHMITESLNSLIEKFPGYLSSKDVNNTLQVSEFKDGILVFNPTGESVTKDIVTRDGSVVSVTLAAYEFKFMGPKNANTKTSGDSKKLTRARIIELLYLRAGYPDVSGLGSHPFGDVPASAGYNDALKWGYANGIVTGLGGRYRPDEVISRQDLAVFFMRYAEYIKMNIMQARDYEVFGDAELIGDYAKAAVKWCYEMGVINDRPGSLFDPLGVATQDDIEIFLKRIL